MSLPLTLKEFTSVDNEIVYHPVNFDTEFLYHPLSLRRAVGLGGEFCSVGLTGVHVQNEAAVGQPVNHGGYHGLVLKHGQPL